MNNFSKLFLVIGAAVFSCDSYDPTPSPESASYFPLKVGNRWVYEQARQDEPYWYSATFTVVAKKVIQETEYFAMETIFESDRSTPSKDTTYYRVDSNGFVYELRTRGKQESNRFRLDAEAGDTWSIPFFQEFVYVVTTSIADVTLTNTVLHECKVFNYDVAGWADVDHYYTLAKGIGIVQHGGSGFSYRLKSATVAP